MHTKPQVTPLTGTELPTPRDGSPLDAVSMRPPVNVGAHQLSVARTWVARGFPVVPCSRTDKGPMVKGFGKDRSDAEMTEFFAPAQIETWWSGPFRRAHVGLLTGRGTDGRGLVVIDCDIRKATSKVSEKYATAASGTDVLERLATEAGADWPDTYTTLTPSGGVHLHFRQPVDGPLIGCATGDHPSPPHLGPLIDVRGIGGLVIAPGSYSAAQGIAYRRISAPGMLPQPLPAWLLARLRPNVVEQPRPPAPRIHQLATGTRAEKYAIVAFAGETEKVSQAGEGERNRTLFASARRLGELAATAPAILTESVVHDQLLAAALSSGQPNREAVRTIHSGWARGVRDGLSAGAA
jgi:hypothetical protein